MIFTPSFQDVLSSRLQEPNPLIQVLLGPRQVGKTTAAQKIHDNWDGEKIMVTADSPSPPSPEWIRFHWQQARHKGPNTLLIIDEVQKIQGWSEQVKILFDQDRGRSGLKILLLGSSSLNLQKGLGESLAGRFELVFAPHWTHFDCHQAFNWDFETYLKFGGYPGAADLIKDEQRWRNYILQSIIDPVLGKDIISQTRINKPALFRQCFELAVQYTAQEISLNKILGQLQDKGNAITVKHYLDLFEKSFLIKVLQKYSGSSIFARASSPKIVVLNSALVNAYNAHERLEKDPSWYGRVFESAIGAQLSLIPGSELFYWRDKRLEVDFVLKTPKGLWAIEIKSGLKPGGTEGLEKFSQRYSCAKCEVWGFDDCLDFLNGKKKID